MLMNCTSEYPIKDYANVRLGVIAKLREKFGVLVGQSDHTKDSYTVFAAVALGAKVIEKHFTLDRNGGFPDDFMSFDPPMMKELVSGIRKIEEAVKVSDKMVTAEEKETRSWAFHSVVANADLRAGDVLRLDSVKTARPGWGIPAKYLDKNYFTEILGKRFNKNINKNTLIRWEDLEA